MKINPAPTTLPPAGRQEIFKNMRRQGLSVPSGMYTIVTYSSGDLDCGALRVRAGGNPAMFFDNLQEMGGELRRRCARVGRI